MILSRRGLLSISAVAGLTGCGAISAVSSASDPLDTYTLTPLALAADRSGGSGHLVVELPTTGGELATDRILIKPLPYQAQYLPDGRWTEPAPDLLQTLIVASFQNLGGFRLVGRTANGLTPDYTLMTEIQDFQAEPAGQDHLVRINIMATLIRESDRSIVASRRFSATETVGSDETQTVVEGFDRALQKVLPDLVAWTVR